ncbi:hypothetical protein N8912_04580, partial [Rhodobacteraceae bacterium]|nr:hypothetical protein [Paracoccaceae bacterium]
SLKLYCLKSSDYSQLCTLDSIQKLQKKKSVSNGNELKKCVPLEKMAAHKKHYKIKGGKPIEALDPESIKLCFYENNFTELFDNLGILGEYQLEYTNLQ